MICISNRSSRVKRLSWWFEQEMGDLDEDSSRDGWKLFDPMCILKAEPTDPADEWDLGKEKGKTGGRVVPGCGEWGGSIISILIAIYHQLLGRVRSEVWLEEWRGREKLPARSENTLKVPLWSRVP